MRLGLPSLLVASAALSLLPACPSDDTADTGLSTFGQETTGDPTTDPTVGEETSSTAATLTTTTTTTGDGDGDPGGECGDGVVDAGEECDLGMGNSDTGQCTSNCRIAECGDGLVYEGFEECDDGNSSNSDECVSGCKLATCGDGYVHEGVEECDDANDDEADGCSSACTPGVCGDGVVQEGEQCDDANADNSDDCLDTCQLAWCGDGHVHAGIEFCDDGGESADCDTDCTPSECGDALHNPSAGEECDDGDDDPYNDCTTECMLPACGDGYLHEGAGELCDGEDFGEASCSDYENFNSGDLQCTDACEIDTSMCSEASCPDNGAYVNGYCWYASNVCETAQQKCGSYGLIGPNGYTQTEWSQAVMDEIAAQLGLISGGDAGCCVEFGWIANGTIYTHNFGNQFYNWPNCFSNNPTLKLCLAP